MGGIELDANAYLKSLGLGVDDAARPAIGRLSLLGEFMLDGERGVLLRPKRGEVSARYLELLIEEGYRFVIVNSMGYPSFYAREGESFAPVRALPVSKPAHFPSTEVLKTWTQLISASAGRGGPARLGVAQFVACMDDDSICEPGLVRFTSEVPVARLGGSAAADSEPLRTAAALLAGYRIHPEKPSEMARLLGALSSLLPDKGQFSGLTEALATLVGARHLGARRLLVSRGAGAEPSFLTGASGTIVLPVEHQLLEPVLERVLPNLERIFSDFLQPSFGSGYDGVVVIPPLGHQLSGADAHLARFELSKRGGKPRERVPAELLYVEHALAATCEGGLLVTILPEGLLSSTGYAYFRAWLLEHARLLAVISLPPGVCFRGTGMKCSVVLLRKSVSTADYPILMIDVESVGLNSDLEAARTMLDEFLGREEPVCA